MLIQRCRLYQWETKQTQKQSTNIAFKHIHRREVSFEEGQSFAKKNNLLFFETSAKTAQNVEKAFMTTTQIILENIEKGEYDLSNEVII